MTNKVTVAAAMIGIFALAGCGNNEASSPDASPASTNTSSVASGAIAPVPKGEVSLLDSELLAKAQWVGKETGCQLDSIDGNTSVHTIKLDRGQPHIFRGWLLDENKLPPAKFSLVFKGKQDYAIAAATGELRKDVGEYFKQPAASTAGFSVSADLSILPAGDYTLTFLMQKANGAFFCDTGRKVSLN